MARGTAVMFNEFLKNLGTGVHDFSADTLKLAMIDNTVTPAADDATPTWSDYSANEVSGGTSYVAGGATLSGVTWTVNGTTGEVELAANDVTWTIDGSGPTDCYFGVLYDDTASGDECIAFFDMAGPVSLQADDISFEWAGGIVLKLVPNPT